MVCWGLAESGTTEVVGRCSPVRSDRLCDPLRVGEVQLGLIVRSEHRSRPGVCQLRINPAALVGPEKRSAPWRECASATLSLRRNLCEGTGACEAQRCSDQTGSPSIRTSCRTDNRSRGFRLNCLVSAPSRSPPRRVRRIASSAWHSNPGVTVTLNDSVLAAIFTPAP